MTAIREHWHSRLGFILAASGSAIGLGNLWKFPFIAWENDGGGFVLVYLACIVAVGLPIMLAEILIGRRAQRSPVGAMRAVAGGPWALAGGWGVLTGGVILGYYTVVAGWTLSYFLRCLEWSLFGFPDEADLASMFIAFAADGPAQIGFSVLFAIATTALIYFGVGRGIERAVRALMPILFLILLLLLASALSMSGAGEALQRLFAPRMDGLSWKGVLEALGHSFFTLSLGMGAMVTYGSYMARSTSVVRAGALIVALDTLVALMATVIMFAVIYSVAGMEAQVGRSTVGMLFIALPKLFYEAVPFGALLAPLFYVLAAVAALTSAISLLEVVTSYFIDEHGVRRRVAAPACGLGIFVLTVLCSLSLGGWEWASAIRLFPGKEGLFSGLDHLAANWLLPIGGFLITLAAGWAMGREATRAELADGSEPGWFRYGVWRFFIRYLAPLAVAAIIAAVVFFGADFT